MLASAQKYDSLTNRALSVVEVQKTGAADDDVHADETSNRKTGMCGGRGKKPADV